MTGRTHVVVIYTVAGGGHVAAARALKAILEQTGLYRVTLVNPYVELMPHMDLWKRLSGRTSEDIYNESVIRDGKTGLFCLGYYAGILLNFKLAYREGRRLLGAYFEEQKPDMVITVLPMLNRVIFDALADYRAAAPERGKVPGVVLITDWTEYGRHIWFPKGSDYHAICGTEEAARRAEGYRALAGRVHRTQGLLLKPTFQAGAPEDRAEAKRALGLDPDPVRPVVCMLYGGHGSWRMRDMALAMAEMAPEAQVLFLCGHNDALADDLRGRDWPFPNQVVGFTQEVPKYLEASDIFVGKPGPGSVSEAVNCGLFLFLDRTMALPQEMPVLKWAKRTGAGRPFASRRSFQRGLADLLDRARSGAEQPEARPNTASREVAGILGTILEA